jgi:hypothetical protein
VPHGARYPGRIQTVLLQLVLNGKERDARNFVSASLLGHEHKTLRPSRTTQRVSDSFPKTRSGVTCHPSAASERCTAAQRGRAAADEPVAPRCFAVFVSVAVSGPSSKLSTALLVSWRYRANPGGKVGERQPWLQVLRGHHRIGWSFTAAVGTCLCNRETCGQSPQPVAVERSAIVFGRIIAGLTAAAGVLLWLVAPAAAMSTSPATARTSFELVAGPYQSNADCTAALANWPAEYYCSTPPPVVAWLIPAGWYVTTTRN